ncbi:choice-of-anchor M domain-containing protein [Actinoplanes sp. TRM 88003]|uniref:Choice-of-anchor M domain-containing protein n=1 Tax=Paractinoplanes aksuensis TaxID=2939490 RepID=A0ABT1E3S2_9ACTN|nr:choice-of-anchor M domain-containing protein [Actinoplanes aksuensis]MCO8277794.1 choice-of-anchor M domain-containing protein [Actinoplanes aksuensis]
MSAVALLDPSPALAAEAVVLAKGHTDAIDVHYEGGALKLKVKDDTVSPAVERDPADVTFQVLPAAETTVPDLPAFSFLGQAGSKIWMLPQVQDAALLWPGWNTGQLDSGVFAGNKVVISLIGVDGPGDVTLFDTNSLGTPNVKFRSSDGLPDRLDVPVHTHAHASWVFSAQGAYTLKFQADAALTNGTTVSTGPIDYRFVVGDRQSGGGDVGLSVSGMAEGDYQPGTTVTLQAVQSPQGPLTKYQWFAKKAGEDDYTPIQGETGASYSFTATRALNATDYVVRLYDGETVAAESNPVTLWVAPPSSGSSAAKSVTATIQASEGALVISVDPEDRTVTLPAATLAAAGDRWESSGALRPVTVTDTRAAKPGWTASGQVADGFRTEDGQSFAGGYLGWTPSITQQGDEQGVVAGPVAAPYVAGQPGTGLGDSAALASAPNGQGLGTAELDAALKLSVPTDTAAGTYTGTLTLTAI